MDALEVIFSRRSIGKYLDKPVEEEALPTQAEERCAPDKIHRERW